MEFRDPRIRVAFYLTGASATARRPGREERRQWRSSQRFRTIL